MFGLVDKSSQRVCPLTDYTLAATFQDQFGQVKIVQSYHNPRKNPVEAVFVWPKDEKAAVTELVVEIDGKRIRADIMAKEQAQNKYDDAIAAGNSAYLLQQSRPDVLEISVGNLPPKSTATVNLTFATTAAYDGNALRVTLPMTLVPRYVPLAETVLPQDKLPADYSKTSKLPYKFEASYEFNSLSQIKAVSSPSHGNQIKVKRPTKNQAVISFDLSDTSAANRDLVMLVEQQPLNKPQFIAETSKNGKGCALALSFQPSILLKEMTAPHTQNQAKPSEFYFVVDRSGSMAGANIRWAIDYLKTFLSKLPTDLAYFNIVSFGGNYNAMYPSVKQSTKANIEQTIQKVKNFHSDMGGTELYGPMDYIFKQPINQQASVRYIFVLTDGEIDSEGQLINRVQTACASTSGAKTIVHSVGIGSTVSHSLVNGLARAGGGTADFVSNTAEDVLGKVNRQISRCFTVCEVEIDWPKQSKTMQLPPGRFTCGEDDRLQVFALCETIPEDVGVSITESSGESLFKARLNLRREAKFTTANPREQSTTFIHQLGVKTYFDYVAAGTFGKVDDTLKVKVVALSTEHHVLSRYTAFIAVEERTDAVTGEMTLLRVPLALPGQAPGQVPPASVSSAGSRFSYCYKSTIGADFENSEINTNNGTLQCQWWDTAGQERFHCLGRSYYRGCGLALLVFDLSNHKSFENLETWRNEILASNNSELSMIVIGTKSDLPHKVDTAEAQVYAQSVNAAYFEVSAKTMDGMEKLAQYLHGLVFLHLSTQGGRLCKIITLGDSGVGKSCLSKQLAAYRGSIDRDFDDNGPSAAPSAIVPNTPSSTNSGVFDQVASAIASASAAVFSWWRS